MLPIPPMIAQGYLDGVKGKLASFRNYYQQHDVDGNLMGAEIVGQENTDGNITKAVEDNGNDVTAHLSIDNVIARRDVKLNGLDGKRQTLAEIIAELELKAFRGEPTDPDDA